MCDRSFIEYIISTYSEVNGEQETKNNLVEPFLKELGYDIDCIDDIKTEVTCDAGKNNEKVDYVLCIAGTPKIIVEAKDRKEKLGSKYINQLFRYFSTSDCKVAVLTNGIEYLFFSDFQKENIMDKEPFYKINILYMKDEDRRFLNNLCKVQQCSYPVENFIIEEKTKRLLKDRVQLSQIISVCFFQDLSVRDAVLNGIVKAIKGGI